MAQFYRDWTEYSLGAGVGSGIADITPFLVATTYTTEVIETPLSASGRGLYNNRGGFTNVAIWRLDFAGSSIDEGEVFVQYYAETDHREAMNLSAVGMLRDSPQIQAYGGGSRLAGGGSNVRDYLESYADTGFTALGQTDQWEYADHQRLRNTLLRWRDTGSTVELKVRCWWADETEPSVWTLETSDATYAGQPGYAGFSRTSNSNRAQVITFIGVGTGGDAAPRSAGGGPGDNDAVEHAESTVSGDSFAPVVHASVSLTFGTTAADARTGTAAAVQSWTEGAIVADSRAATAHVTAGIVEAISAGDAPNSILEIIRELSEGASGDAVLSALAQAAGALLAGAEAGEQWALDILSSGAFSSGVTATDTWLRSAEGFESRILNYGSEAASVFAAAAQSLASLSAGATAADAIIAVSQVLSAITAQIQAGDAWTADQFTVALLQASAQAGDSWSSTLSQIVYSLTASATAAEVLSCIAQSAAAISEGVKTNSQFVARIAGQGNFTVGAIAVTAAIRATIAVTAAIRATININSR